MIIWMEKFLLNPQILILIQMQILEMRMVVGESHIYFFRFKKDFIHLISICSLADNLNSRQLLANAEIRLPNNERLGL